VSRSRSDSPRRRLSLSAADRLIVDRSQHDLDCQGDRDRENHADDSEKSASGQEAEDHQGRVNPRRIAEQERPNQLVDRKPER